MAKRGRTPQPEKPPFIKFPPGSTLNWRVTMWQERLIGRAIVASSKIDAAMHDTIWKFLSLDVDDGRSITMSMDAKYKLSTLRRLGDRHLPEGVKDAFRDVCNRIQWVYEDRNMIAHGSWGMLEPDSIPAVMAVKVTDEIPDGEFHTETYPAARMYKIIDECRNLVQELLATQSALDTLRDKSPAQDDHTKDHP